MTDSEAFALSCPIPISDYPTVTMAHGGGGRLMNQLIEKMILPAFDNPALSARHDGAVFDAPPGRLAFTTDSHVISPLFFPGSDIGALAVNGTVNDLAMCGARPLYLSLGLIIEEGLEMATLWRVVQSIRRAADLAGTRIGAGDTKVVERGKGDGLFINTAGIGVLEHDLTIGPGSVKPGDAIVLSGDIARHGMAVMAVREGLVFESEIESDCEELVSSVRALLDAGLEIHCLRDLTRGGLSSALIEIAEAARVDMLVKESSIAVREDVRGACEILGFDPLYVANEGRFIAILPAGQSERALEIMRGRPSGESAAIIGRVVEGDSGLVSIETAIGAERVLDMLSGEQLPRIC